MDNPVFVVKDANDDSQSQDYTTTTTNNRTKTKQATTEDIQQVHEKADTAVELEDHDETEDGKDNGIPKDMLYTVDDVPPWYLCIFLGFQHYLTMLGGSITIPILFARPLCIEGDNVGLGEFISTIFFVCGIGTLLQSTVGVRLPIIQGATIAFLAPTVVLMSQPEWKCPYIDAENGLINITDLPPLGSEGHKEIWKARLCQLQGSLMVSAIFQVVIGYSGLLGIILKYIGPLSIAPTIALISLPVFSDIAAIAATQWYIAFTTMFFVVLFSQYLDRITVPICTFVSGKGCVPYYVPIFKLFPIICAMVLSWIICAILTATNVLPEGKDEWGYPARTDIRLDALDNSQWFRVPYPGQWGMPTVSVAGVFAMLAAVLASMIESVGDYIACARLSGAPPPPTYAINRGSGTEGLIVMISGLWGSGPGLTSYSENVGAIGITKVGSRRVVQYSAVILIILGCLGKFGALFVTIPTPVIGGILLITLGMVASVGLSNLQFVDMSSSRNIFILGTALFFGLAFPLWIKNHTTAISTGNSTVDHLLTVLLSTGMFVGGLTGFVLDNTIPGTDEERGLTKWRSLASGSGPDNEDNPVYDTYHIPFLDNCLKKFTIMRYIPFVSQFRMKYYCPCCKRCCKSKDKEEERKENRENTVFVERL